jgi:hypothetical protein
MVNDLEILQSLTDARTWQQTVQQVLRGEPLPWKDEDFDTYWIVAGHHIREQVGDDRLLIDFLREVLPPYVGSSVVLFRGESRKRFSVGNIGLSWSQDEAIAEMFAKGLNCMGGGVVLRATFDALAVIAGPNAHSRYLGEHQYTTDPLATRNIEVVSEFEPKDA